MHHAHGVSLDDSFGTVTRLYLLYLDLGSLLAARACLASQAHPRVCVRVSCGRPCVRCAVRCGRPNSVGDARKRTCTRAVHLLRPRRSPATSCNLARSVSPLSVPRARARPTAPSFAPTARWCNTSGHGTCLTLTYDASACMRPHMQAPCWSTPSICRAGRTVQQDAGEYTPRGARAQRHQRGDAGPMRTSNVSMHALRFMRVFPPAWLPTDDVAHASAMYEWQACIKHAERMPIADVLAIPHASVASTSNSTHATHNIAPAANPSPAGCIRTK